MKKLRKTFRDRNWRQSASFLISIFICQAAFANSLPICPAVHTGDSRVEKIETEEITDLAGLGKAMTQGMQLEAGQESVFDVYRSVFFGEPKTGLNGKTLADVLAILKQNPELKKIPFREMEISRVAKIYETPDALIKYLKSATQTAGQVRSSLIQIDSNIALWKKILGYQDLPLPKDLQKQLDRNSTDQEKLRYRKQKAEFDAKSQKRFQAYLNRMISRTDRELIASLKNEKEDYQKKTMALYNALNFIREWLDRKGRDTREIRQAMVDLVHTNGFANAATQELLKSPNGLDKIEGLRKILDERDSMAIALGYPGHFQELQAKLQIDFPTGLSKNENPSASISKLEKEVLAGKFSTKPVDTIRVRSLSIQEAPFRSCLGGSDCSSRTYFEKALDPNFNYFTMTTPDFHSSGHVTVVLGEATNLSTNQKIKVAFVDKLQNVPNQLIPDFLRAVSQSLAEHGYLLGLPANVGDHNGLSNMDTIRHFVEQVLIPRSSRQLVSFVPHPQTYQSKNAYSRAYNQLDVRIFEPIARADQTEINVGKLHKPFSAPTNLDLEALTQKLRRKADSPNEKDILEFIDQAANLEMIPGTQAITGFYGKKLEELLQKKESSFSVRKKAMMAQLMKNPSPDLYAESKRYFTDAEWTQVNSELKQWGVSSHVSRRNFYETMSSAILTKLTSLKLSEEKVAQEIGGPFFAGEVLGHFIRYGLQTKSKLIFQTLFDQKFLKPQELSEVAYTEFNGRAAVKRYSVLLLAKLSDLNSVELVEVFLKNGMSPNIQIKERSFLEISIERNQTEVVEKLFQYGAKVGIQGNQVVFKSLQNEKIFRLLVRNGADLNTVDTQGWSVLMRALKANSPSAIIDILLKKTSNIDYKSPDGQSALTVAETENIPGLVQISKLRRIKIDGSMVLNHARRVEERVRDGFSMRNNLVEYIYALNHSGFRKEEISNLLREISPELKAQILAEPKNLSLTMKALVFESILEKHKMNEPFLDGEYLIHHVAGEPRLLRKLIERGADVNVEDGFDRTPLHLAIEKRQAESVEMLLRAGARTDVYRNGEPVVYSAIIDYDGDVGSEKIAAMIIQSSGLASIQLKNEHGGSILHRAMNYGYHESAKILMENGADPLEKNARGLNAYEVAAKKGNREGIEILKKTKRIYFPDPEKFFVKRE